MINYVDFTARQSSLVQCVDIHSHVDVVYTESPKAATVMPAKNVTRPLPPVPPSDQLVTSCWLISQDVR